MRHESASNLLPGASDALPSARVEAHEAVEHSPTGRGTKERSARRTITKANLSRLICPPGKSEAFYWDSQVPGLGLRAYGAGKRVWLLQYRDANRNTRRIGLGDVKAVDPEKARDAARFQLTQRAI